jgi:hypothetical protein
MRDSQSRRPMNNTPHCGKGTEGSRNYSWKYSPERFVLQSKTQSELEAHSQGDGGAIRSQTRADVVAESANVIIGSLQEISISDVQTHR